MTLYPLLTVKNIESAIVYYCDVLGFVLIEQRPRGDNPQRVLLQRDDVTLALRQKSFSSDPDQVTTEGARGEFVITVKGIDSLFADLSAKNIKLHSRITVQTNGEKEFAIEDHDKNVIRFIQFAPT